MPSRSVDGSSSLADEGKDAEGRVHIRGTVNFGMGIGSVGEFVLTERNGAWTVANLSWRPYESPGQ